MKIITCASYYGSGSSALTDLVAEYNNVKDLSDFEFRFLHDLDGVRDLEYHLVENHNRQNSGHALKRFDKLSKFNEGNFMSKRYSQFFSGDDYKKITQKYIDELVDFSYPGWWFYDLYDKGPRLYYVYQIANHLFRKIDKGKLRILRKERTINTHPSEEKFLEITRNYVSDLMHALNKEGYDYLEIDQIVPSANTESVMRYFKDEIFVFIVDRDPRDVYLLGKYCWKDDICPSDPDLFCQWFEYARKAGSGVPKETDHLIHINFEDLIYRYDETVERIEHITGLDSTKHNNQFKKMNPKQSIINTRLWNVYAEDDGLKTIESNLSDYLYDYSGVDTTNISGIDVTDPSFF